MDHEAASRWRDLDTVTRAVPGELGVADLRVPGLTILGHPDVRRVGERSVLTELVAGREVALSRLEPAFAAEGEMRRQPLADPHLSRSPVRILPTSQGGVRLVVGPARTHVAVNGRELAACRDFTGRELERGLVILLARRIALLLHLLEPLPARGVRPYGLVGESAGLLAVRQQIARVADLDVPALLRGETGTGKELVASAIHTASRRRDGPFVAVNMGAVPPALAAAELFGAAKGAFTGADRPRTGYFTRAQGGTLFLDEIGETPPELQVLLLRTLETGVVQPLGSETPRRVDVRILAATDADLGSAIAAGRFREPLLHRLSGFEIRLPPLRERRDDLGVLLVHFLRRELETLGEPRRLDDSAAGEPWLPASVVARLAAYDWPGNVRQLINVVRQLAIHHRGAPQLRLTPEVEKLLAGTSGIAAEEKAIEEPAAEVPVSPVAPWTADQRAVLRTLLASDLDRELVESLDDGRARDIRARHDRQARRLLGRHGGEEVDRSDGFLLLFERPADAVAYSLAYHDALGALSRSLGVELRARVGIHLGEVRVRRNPPPEVARGAGAVEVEGPARPLASRLMALAEGGQTLLTRHAFDLARQSATADPVLAAPLVRWATHGAFPVRGHGELELFEVGVEGAAPLRPPSSLLDPAAAKPEYRPPAEVSDAELEAALRAHDYRIQPTAAALGVSRTSLYALIDKSPSVRKARDLGSDEIETCRRRLNGDLDAMAADLGVSRKGLHRRMTQLGLHPRQ